LAARVARAKERVNPADSTSDDDESEQAAGKMAGLDEK
jgi:hypothetical protein